MTPTNSTSQFGLTVIGTPVAAAKSGRKTHIGTLTTRATITARGLGITNPISLTMRETSGPNSSHSATNIPTMAQAVRMSCRGRCGKSAGMTKAAATRTAITGIAPTSTLTRVDMVVLRCKRSG